MVGSYSPNNVKAELYDFGTGVWEVTEDYPFASGYLAFKGETVRISSFVGLFLDAFSL